MGRMVTVAMTRHHDTRISGVEDLAVSLPTHKSSHGGYLKRHRTTDFQSSFIENPDHRILSPPSHANMKFVLSSLTAAALALIASAAPAELAKEVTTDLPARFAMYIVTAEPRVNGLRVHYLDGKSHSTAFSPLSPAI